MEKGVGEVGRSVVEWNWKLQQVKLRQPIFC